MEVLRTLGQSRKKYKMKFEGLLLGIICIFTVHFNVKVKILGDKSENV